jgi:hypothetical protein
VIEDLRVLGGILRELCGQNLFALHLGTPKDFNRKERREIPAKFAEKTQSGCYPASSVLSWSSATPHLE